MGISQWVVVGVLLVWGLPTTGLGQDAKHGAQAYKLCASCHGFKGEGNQLVNAPGLAGQETWYLERQINNFRNGIRGSTRDDVHGQTMAQMTVGLDSSRAVADLVAYIGTLPVYRAAATVVGDLDKGAAQYAPCSACHGTRAEGNALLNSPALAGMDDWYQLAQLKKFKDGRRGAIPEDIYGQQMAPMMITLADEQAMIDVVAYVNSLQ